PARVLARLDENGRKVGATLGAFAFVVLERDPARSLTDPPPRTCRVLEADAPLRAPLLREREPARRWLVRRARGAIPDDASALVRDGAAKNLRPDGRPRLIFDERGALVALALPVAAGEGT